MFNLGNVRGQPGRQSTVASHEDLVQTTPGQSILQILDAGVQGRERHCLDVRLRIQ